MKRPSSLATRRPSPVAAACQVERTGAACQVERTGAACQVVGTGAASSSAADTGAAPWQAVRAVAVARPRRPPFLQTFVIN